MRHKVPGHARLNLLSRNVVLAPYLRFLLALDLCISVSVEHKWKRCQEGSQVWKGQEVKWRQGGHRGWRVGKMQRKMTDYFIK